MKLFAVRQALLAEPSRSGIRLSVWLLALVSAVVLVRISFGTATASGPKKSSSAHAVASLSKAPTTRFENAENRRINLSGGSDLVTSYKGSEEAARALDRNEATPLAAASDDFDEDGTPDLVCAYRWPRGGILTLHRGNVDSIYPNAPEARERRAQGKFTDAPFLSPASVFELAEQPDLIGAGDFDADDHRDLITARMGGNALWFSSGDGHGGFAEARQIVLLGAVTAMTVGEINRRDGLPDIVVAVTGEAGDRALVFESPLGAAGARPEEFDLPAPAASVALGEIVGDYEQDLAIAAGNQLIVLKGRDRKLSFDASNQPPVERAEVSSRSLSFNIKSLVIGNFRGDNHTDIAMLGDDGRVRISRNPRLAPSKRRKTTLAGWRTRLLETDPWTLASKIARARVSSNPVDSLLVLDSESHRLNIIDQKPEVTSKKSGITTLASSARGPMVSSLVSDSEPIAVLPMRLNSAALSSLVLLNRGRSSASIVFPAAPMTFTVDDTVDGSDANPGDGICDNGLGECTLRSAIQEANANVGSDTINFSIGAGAQTITPAADLPFISEAVTIDGNTQPGFAGSPIIEIDSTNLTNGLVVNGGNSTIRGLVINRAPGPGSGTIQLQTGGNNIIEGNFIGTDISGTAASTNNSIGVFAFGSSGNRIGGTVAASRNLISGNTDGLFFVFGSSGNVVQGNLIGTDITGTTAIGNGVTGVGAGPIDNNQTIGGTAAGARNIISANNAPGINLNGSGSLIQGNLVGTNSTGAAALGNNSGIALLANTATSNTVGGVTGASRNVISGNIGDGVCIDVNAANNLIQGNFIGTEVTGATALPNGEGVVVRDGASGNMIGGTVAGARNIISGNTGRDVFIALAGTNNNLVQGNFIGTDVTGMTAVPNGSGVELQVAGNNNTIGGTSAAARNIISGNTFQGVDLNGSSGNFVQGNFIGTQANGASPLPNTVDGVNIDGSSSTNTVGGTLAGARNVIAFNGGRGINAISGTSNALLTNSIFSNASLGIDLNQDGVTPNDTGDADGGPNNLQNFPVLTSATPGATTTIQGTLNSTPNTTFRVEFFSNPACDGSGNGEGTTLLGFTNITTNGSGNATINVTLPVSVPLGNVVVATATNPANSTSEFSACITVASSGCTINCPPNQTVLNAPNQCGSTVNYPAPATAGACGAVSCVPASGTFFAVGNTTVTCATGGGPTCSFTVTVVDDTPPVLACPADISKATDPGKPTAMIDYAPATATDNCSTATVVCLPPPGFTASIGVTTVGCTGWDASNNTSSCSFTVTVTDSEPPGIRCPANVTTEIAPGQTSGVVTYPPPVVSDNLPGATFSCAPSSGSRFPLGATTVNCTATDSSGNRSSCSFTVTINGGTPAVIVTLPEGKPRIEYGEDDPVTPRRKPPKKRNNSCGLFTVENTSRAPVVLTYDSVVRRGSAVDSGKIGDPNEKGFYQLSIINDDSTETEVPTGTTVTVGIGQSVSFCLRFIALIPAVTTSTTDLPATAVLSEEVNSRCNFTVQGGSPASVDVAANVDTNLLLINPDNPRKSPRVTFARSGNEFILTYSVYDSNLDVNRAKYEFLDSRGNVVGQAIEVDLSQPISSRSLLKGQSFTVEQRFTGANSHREITGCRVTVFDGETNVSKTASGGQSSTASLARRSTRATLRLPVVRIDPGIGEPR